MDIDQKYIENLEQVIVNDSQAFAEIMAEAISGFADAVVVANVQYSPAHVLAAVKKLKDRITALENAIKEHRDQKADDRCIEDDDRLYEALGDGIKCDRRVGDKAAMLRNCERFIDNRCESGGWASYAELEEALKPFARMDREDCDLNEVVCVRGPKFSLITARDFRKAAEVLGKNVSSR